jgi:hypothetical protein
MKTTKQNFRSAVFNYAWSIVKSTGKSFNIALVKAWQIFKLKRQLSAGKVKFAFEKADGSLRYALGTLKNVSGSIKGTGKQNFKSIAYFDVDADAFRSFKVENLIKIY